MELGPDPGSDPPDGPHCERCGSFKLEHVARAPTRKCLRANAAALVEWRNRCLECHRLQEYIPTKGVIAAECARIRSAAIAGESSRASRTERKSALLPREQYYRAGVPTHIIRAVKTTHGSTKERARFFGLSISTVHKIRQGLLDPCENASAIGRPLCSEAIGWCRRCRCNVIFPCKTCKIVCGDDLRLVTNPRRPRIPASAIGDPRLRARLELWVSQIGLPLRVVNYLEHNEYFLVAHLLAATEDELFKINGLSFGALKRIRLVMRRLGFGVEPTRSARVDTPSTPPQQ